MNLKRIALAALACMSLVFVAVWYELKQQPLNSNTDSFSISKEILGMTDQAYAMVTAPRPFVFPDDHGPHSEYRSEWWYFTGNVTAQSGESYGYQFTVFRQAINNREKQTDSNWETNQIYMAHLALTDSNNNQYFSDERFSRGALGLAEATSSPFAVRVDDWLATGKSIPDCTGCLELVIRAAGDGYSIDLNLKSIKPVVYQGDRGFSQKGESQGNASHYYSLTRLETTGILTVGEAEKLVSGSSWMDHEWSTSALGNNLAGWDWVAIQLDDGREIMYYQLRTLEGRAHEISQGAIVDERGLSQRLLTDNVTFSSFLTWTSGETTVTYPVAWDLGLPQQNLVLQIEPVVNAQEHTGVFRYWEGAIKVSGSDGAMPIEGVGYLELVGYE